MPLPTCYLPALQGENAVLLEKCNLYNVFRHLVEKAVLWSSFSAEGPRWLLKYVCMGATLGEPACEEREPRGMTWKMREAPVRSWALAVFTCMFGTVKL